MKRSLNPDQTEPLLSYDFDRGSNYEGVLHLTTALSALVPEGDGEHPDHRFFQVVHLISEYAWAQVHYELRRVKEHLDHDRPLPAVRLVDRAHGLSEVTVSAVRLLGDHLPQHSLLTMRNALPDDATGLDSPGYRNLRRVARPVWKAFENAMGRAGTTTGGLIAVQGDDDPAGGPAVHALALVREALLRLDSSVLNWKKAHLVMVWSQLGGQAGLRRDEGDEGLPESLGGRAISTMDTRSDFPLFPELWRAAEHTYWTQGTRHGASAEPGVCPVSHD